MISKKDFLKNPLFSIRSDSSFECNHCLFSNNGNYFLFINRYEDDKNKCSKLILASTEHPDFNFQVINKDFVSHMCWVDNQNLFYFGDAKDDNVGYYIYNIKSSKSKKIMPSNLNDGHPSANKNNNWVVLDSYPDNKCKSHLYLYNILSGKVINIAKFSTNVKYQGYYRCDLHPRWNNAGDKVMVDTLYKNKRASFILDLKEIVND